MLSRRRISCIRFRRGVAGILVGAVSRSMANRGPVPPPHRARVILAAAVAARLILLATFLAMWSGIAALADEPSPSALPTRDTWGEVGILDMPSARVADDAQISATIGLMENTQRYNFDFQVTPWFEATFRYGHISSPNGFFDYHRNLGLKFHLLDESEYLPDVAIGARDIIGTGRQGAEYLVATKNIYDVDMTVGLGWGRLSSVDAFPNPFATIFPSFATRAVSPPTGGTLAYGQLFHGPSMGIFGGINWRTPIEGLNFLAEYSSDKYVIEAQEFIIRPRTPVNVGLSYAVLSDLRIMAGWFYGTSYGVTISYTKDPTRSSFPVRIGPTIPPPRVRTDQQQAQALSDLVTRSGQRAEYPVVSAVSPSEVALSEALMSETRGVKDIAVDGKTLLVDATYFEPADEQCKNYAVITAASGVAIDSIALTNSADTSGDVSICSVADVRSERIAEERGPQNERQIRDDIAAQQLQVDALTFGPNEIWLYYRNDRYRTETEAAGRAVKVLMQDAPPEVEIFHLLLVKHGIAMREFRVIRSAVERTAVAGGATRELGGAVELLLPPVNQDFLNEELAKEEPRFSWSLVPGLKQSFFDPRSPIQVQVLARAVADVEFAPGLDVLGEYDLNIYNNFDTKTPSASVLPHVRSDASKYFRFGASGISVLEGIYRTRLARDVYSEVRIGYLEDMFAGFGGQILWRPDGERLAFGVDLYQVWQRDFDRLFGLQHYNILTGHFSIYYNSPWHDLNFNIHAGRYLAGDYGATIEITRSFDTGVEIGAFATFTNVPFAKFGEGSFDKGFILRIPLEWTLPFYTQSEHYSILHSLARDGGQRLYNDDPLYQETRSSSYGEIEPHIDEITDP